MTLGKFLDDMLSRIRRETVFTLSLHLAPSLQSAFCTDRFLNELMQEIRWRLVGKRRGFEGNSTPTGWGIE